MKTILLSLLLLSRLSVYGQESAIATVTQSPIDAKNGFMGVPFGTSRFAIANLQGSGKLRAGLTYYTRTSESLILAEQPLESIYWMFYEDKFYGALITTKSDTNYKRLQDLFTTAYGESVYLNGTHLWQSENLWASLSYEVDNGACFFAIHSKLLEAKKKQDEKRAVKEAADKL